jgi:hypothetical protein
MVREVRIFGSRIRRLRIGEALLILPRIAHGVVCAAIFSERAVGTVSKVLCALWYGRHVHGAWESGAG